MRQSRLQDVCRGIVIDSDGALGCALVDLPTGLPLALDVAPGATLDPDSMGLLAAGAVAQFKRCGESSPGNGRLDGVTEVQFATADAYYFMGCVGGESDQLAVLILDRAATNLGFGWMAMRRALREIEDAYRDVAEVPSGFDRGDAGVPEPPEPPLVETRDVPRDDARPPPMRGPVEPVPGTPARRSIRR